MARTIMVDRDKVASTRLMLSSKGMPTSGSVGYEIFDQTNSLGQTDFVTNLNHQRALEGELACAPSRSLGRRHLRPCPVGAPLPEASQLFEEEAEAPTASVVLGTPTRQISAGQVQGIQNLIAAAVPGLKADKVTITDQTGKMLAGGGADSAVGAMAEERRNQTEEAIRKKVKETVDGVMGPGHARVGVTADLDLSRVTVQEEKFDPDGQVKLSTQTSNVQGRAIQRQSWRPKTNNGVTTANNLPGRQSPIPATTVTPSPTTAARKRAPATRSPRP